MKLDLLVGIDAGTSSVKSVVFGLDGKVVASAKRPYRLFRRDGGVVEQDPAEYISATVGTFSELSEKIPDLADRIAGIGITGQCPSDIFLDENREPLRPSIIWQDTRAVAEATEIAAHFSEEKLYEKLGTNVAISASWTPSRLLWLSRHEPEVAKKCRKILHVKDYLGYFLTGSEVSDTWSFRTVNNIYTGQVYAEYLEFLGFDVECSPESRHICDLRGVVTEKAAAATGLRVGTPVSVGVGDGPATFIGSGAVESDGIAFDSAGTSEIVGISYKEVKNIDKVMTIPPSITGKYAIIYGPTQSGSSSLVWYVNGFMPGVSLDDAEAMIGTVPAGCDGLFFLPYISGERCPLWNPSAVGSFNNVKNIHNSAYFARAVMEGVGFSVRHCLEVASGGKITASKLRISGGGSRTELSCRIKADVCNLEVETLECIDACALGAAMTAAVATGIYPDLSLAAQSMVRALNTYKPDPENREVYDKLFAQYLEASERQKLG